MRTQVRIWLDAAGNRLLRGWRGDGWRLINDQLPIGRRLFGDFGDVASLFRELAFTSVGPPVPFGRVQRLGRALAHIAMEQSMQQNAMPRRQRDRLPLGFGRDRDRRDIQVPPRVLFTQVRIRATSPQERSSGGISS